MRASGYERDADDWYQEQPDADEALLRVEPLAGLRCWDPAAGGGNIPKVLGAHGIECRASDIVDRGWPRTVVSDFFFFLAKENECDAIVSNPPFREFIPWTRHALTMAPLVILLLPTAFLEGTRERKAFYDRTPPARVWTSRARISMPPGKLVGPDGLMEGKDGKRRKPAGGTRCFSWFVFVKGHTGFYQGGWC